MVQILSQVFKLQDHQNIRKMNHWYKLSMYQIELINLFASANKETKRKLTQFSEVSTHVILMNDLANYMWVCFSKSFSQTSLAHPDFKVLDLNVHVKHIMGFFLKGWKIEGFSIRDYCFPNCFQEVLYRDKDVMGKPWSRNYQFNCIQGIFWWVVCLYMKLTIETKIWHQLIKQCGIIIPWWKFDQGCLITVQLYFEISAWWKIPWRYGHTGPHYFCDYNLVSLKITWLP